MISSRISDCRQINLQKIHNVAGNITAINGNADIPFEIERVYYLYDVPGGESRGGHAHKKLQQIIIAASGSYEILIKDGVDEKIFTLSRPYSGLYVPPGLWRELINFSSGAICLVLASTVYSESDYIRDYEEFKKYKKQL